MLRTTGLRSAARCCRSRACCWACSACRSSATISASSSAARASSSGVSVVGRGATGTDSAGLTMRVDRWEGGVARDGCCRGFVWPWFREDPRRLDESVGDGRSRRRHRIAPVEARVRPRQARLLDSTTPCGGPSHRHRRARRPILSVRLALSSSRSRAPAGRLAVAADPSARASDRRLTRGEEGNVLERVLDAHLDKVSQCPREVDDLDRADRGRSRATCERSFQRIGLVRFNPFEDTGGNQSFALALLDGRGDGFVVSSLHARTGTRVYAKADQWRPVRDRAVRRGDRRHCATRWPAGAGRTSGAA